MNKHLRNHVASVFLLVPCTMALLAAPTIALAQNVSPEVRSLEVRSDGEIEPGARLTFRVVGTPGAAATVRIRGLRERIELREVSRGVYVGRYRVQRGDRIDNDSNVRAILRAENRSGSGEYTFAEVLSGRAPAAVAPAAPPPRIERFSLAPIDRIEPGAELRLTLEGYPRATVRVDLPGIEPHVALREIRPGHYEGSYTLRRTDKLNLSRPMVATLRVGERVDTATLAFPVAPPLAVPVTVPLQVVNHSNNGQVEGGSTQILGRTAPFASVAVKVDSNVPVPGGFTVTQHVHSQTLQSDANGNFSFNFSPRFAMSGTRYDIVMVATKGNINTEARLVLHQR